MRGWMIVVGLGVALIGASPATAADSFYVRGGGDGHGIGMSQYGAYGFALHGEDYQYILGHYYRGTTIGQTDPKQLVRVLVRVGSASVSGATQAQGLKQKLNSSSTYGVRQIPGGQLGLYDSSGKLLGKFNAPLHITGPGPLTAAGGATYRGALEFRPDGRKIDTINAVDLEDYVRGVVSAEMPSSWSAQALDAQAVAARTYAITTNVGGTGYQLYSDTRSQMYEGVSAETPATDAAVAATRGRVVTYNGKPVVTYFFASSGGYTENIENVWLGSPPEPWLRGVSDPYDSVAGNPDHRWVVEMSVKQASAKLKGRFRGSFVGIKVTRWGVSPRVVMAQVVGTKGSTPVNGPQLQQVFGLMSTYMSFAKISSSSGSASPSGGGTPTGGAAPGGGTTPGGGTHTFLAVAAAGFEAIPPPPPAIHGTVFPAPGRGEVAVQLRTHGRWRTIGHAGLHRGGAYSMRLPHAGLYRIVWDGFDGPAVSVG
jgi:stage II sporulation protein D